MWDNIKWVKICVTGIPERDIKIFKERKTEHFPYLMKITDSVLCHRYTESEFVG